MIDCLRRKFNRSRLNGFPDSVELTEIFLQVCLLLEFAELESQYVLAVHVKSLSTLGLNVIGVLFARYNSVCILEHLVQSVGSGSPSLKFY